ncbi:MAG TPA: universal stress protein [Kofleriaceae bacterium]|jgi:nucleotide-binding universal stress UspA family protein
MTGVLPKTILLPVDLGEGSDEALDYAVELARAFKARVHILHVVGIPSMGVPEMGVAYSGAMMDGMMTDDLHALERMLAKHRGTCELGEPVVKAGDPRDAINEAAKELGADLIVMATHGRSGISRVLLGSVTESVVRTAPCPVLTVKQHADTEKKAA